MIHRYIHRYSESVVHQYIGTPVHRYTGTPILWYTKSVGYQVVWTPSNLHAECLGSKLSYMSIELTAPAD